MMIDKESAWSKLLQALSFHRIIVENMLLGLFL